MLALLGTASTTHLVGHAFSDVRRCLAPRMNLELTPTLIEWGCDAELWKETRNKQECCACAMCMLLRPDPHTLRRTVPPHSPAQGAAASLLFLGAAGSRRRGRRGEGQGAHPLPAARYQEGEHGRHPVRLPAQGTSAGGSRPGCRRGDAPAPDTQCTLLHPLHAACIHVLPLSGWSVAVRPRTLSQCACTCNRAVSLSSGDQPPVPQPRPWRHAGDPAPPSRGQEGQGLCDRGRAAGRAAAARPRAQRAAADLRECRWRLPAQRRSAGGGRPGRRRPAPVQTNRPDCGGASARHSSPPPLARGARLRFAQGAIRKPLVYYGPAHSGGAPLRRAEPHG